jgi:hypothetical protein
MRNCLLIAAIFIAAISLPHRAAAQMLSGSDDPLRHGHALLIGNSHYRAWPQLVDVPLQLDELAVGLKTHFDTVEVVKDLETDPLRQKINGFLRSYGNDSNARLFIYYAGHGYTETLLPFNENRGYITGIDTPAVDGSERGYNAARLKAMSMMEIRSPLAEVLAKHILVVFDSCFSGTIFTSRAPNDPPRTLSPSVVARLMEKMARDIITAGSANERIPAHSPIPKLLLAAINGEADRYGHGVISAADIKTYLRDQVLNLPGVGLTPQQGRLQDPNFAEGEFLFRVSDTGSPVDHAAEAWAAVRDTTSIAILEQFRTLYARSIYAPFANARIEELKTQISRPTFQTGGGPGPAETATGAKRQEATDQAKGDVPLRRAVSTLLDNATLQAMTEDSLERRGFKRGLLETKGFAKGRAERPICVVNSSVGSCKLEAFAGSEFVKDEFGYTCDKINKTMVYSGCVNGEVHGLAYLRVDGEKKAAPPAYIGLFVRGRAMYPMIEASIGGRYTLLGIDTVDKSYACASFPDWDERSRKEECPFATRVFGSYLMSEAGVRDLKSNTFDFDRVAGDFMKFLRTDVTPPAPAVTTPLTPPMPPPLTPPRPR